uniref:Uncharacterized protein n=1 Tax=Panagrolaimus superbus TaxID=310955 RepID=A0A914YL44_9BILA
MDTKNLKIAELSKSIPDQNAAYTFKNPRPQLFSLSYPIMKYILQNSTGAAWKKLIMTCKYFFSKNPIFPVRQLTTGYEIWNADGKTFNPNQALSHLWLYDVFHGNNAFEHQDNQSMDITLEYVKDLQLSDGYKQMLGNCIAKIIENPPKKIPKIWFPGFINSGQYEEYQKLYRGQN